MSGLSSLLFLALSGHAVPVCNVALQVCPKSLEGTTINVPQDVTYLEPKLPFCPEQVQVQTGTSNRVPSIVFIIDNSGSMSKDGSSGGNDPEEARFTVVRSLLDTIYKISPNAEVGLSIFSRRLQFDHRDNPFFKTAFPGDTSQHDAYVPLTPLNQAFPGGIRGVDTLKALLAYTGEGNLVHATKLPASRANAGYTPDNIRDGTDITLGFEAAKLAMQDAKADPANQYFIFLSDGEPSGVDNIRRPFIDDFEEGAATPTTFTIFFNRDGPNAPASIRDMTGNIRANGYSATNPSSAYWAITLPGTELMTLLRNNVITPIFANQAAVPVSATVVSGGTTVTNSSKDAGNFIFPERVPLAPGQSTVALTYTYSYTDSGRQKTHTATYNLNIRRVASATPPAGVTVVCREQGVLKVVNHNSFSRSDVTTPLDQRKQWVLVNSRNVTVTPEGDPDCCKVVQGLTPADSAKYVGIKVTASRGFKVDIKVYDNLGQFVNKVTFSVSQAEFANLAAEAGTANRSLRVLWDNRTSKGTLAGTGAYIFKTTVTLNRIPGVAEDHLEHTDHRLVGVVRDQ